MEALCPALTSPHWPADEADVDLLSVLIDLVAKSGASMAALASPGGRVECVVEGGGDAVEGLLL